MAAKFAAGLRHAPQSSAAVIASRSGQTARRFAAAFGIPQAVEGYEAAARCGVIDVAYIATPPSEHARHALACIKAGVSVLIEKPFAANAEDARAIVAAARQHGVFCMEAMWTRFLPAPRALKAISQTQQLGDIREITGSFCISDRPDAASSGFSVARGGGALAQRGIYPISLASWLFGLPKIEHASGIMGAGGTDEDASIILRYPGGIRGSFRCSLRVTDDNGFSVLGTHGSTSFLGPVYRPSGLFLRRYEPRDPPSPAAALGRRARLREAGVVQKLAQWRGLRHRDAKLMRHFFAGNGYHYQVLEVERRMAEGLKESPDMPLDESVALVTVLDQLRQRIRENGSEHVRP